jgi:hypothetical protein
MYFHILSPQRRNVARKKSCCSPFKQPLKKNAGNAKYRASWNTNKLGASLEPLLPTSD